MVRPVDFMNIVVPLPHFMCGEVSSLFRSNAAWNIMAVDKAFCKSKDGSFGRSVACREGKSKSRVILVTTYSSKNLILPPP